MDYPLTAPPGASAVNIYKENLQSVPVAVTAITGASVRGLGDEADTRGQGEACLSRLALLLAIELEKPERLSELIELAAHISPPIA